MPGVGLHSGSLYQPSDCKSDPKCCIRTEWIEPKKSAQHALLCPYAQADNALIDMPWQTTLPKQPILLSSMLMGYAYVQEQRLFALLFMLIAAGIYFLATKLNGSYGYLTLFQLLPHRLAYPYPADIVISPGPATIWHFTGHCSTAWSFTPTRSYTSWRFTCSG